MAHHGNALRPARQGAVAFHEKSDHLHAVVLHAAQPVPQATKLSGAANDDRGKLIFAAEEHPAQQARHARVDREKGGGQSREIDNEKEAGNHGVLREHEHHGERGGDVQRGVDREAKVLCGIESQEIHPIRIRAIHLHEQAADRD